MSKKKKNVAPIDILDKRMDGQVLQYRVLWQNKTKSWVEAKKLGRHSKLVKSFENNAKAVEYEVEEIEKHRQKGDIIQYFIKWKGFNRRFNTWENETNMYSQEVVDAYWAKQPDTAKKSQQNNTETSKRKIAYSDRRKKSLSQLVTEKKPPEKTKPVKPKKVAIIKSKTSTQLDYEAICSKIIESNTVAILEVPQLVLVLGLQNETIDTARNKVMVATAQNSITLDAIQRCDVQDNAWLIKVPGPDVLILHKRTLEASFGKIFCYALDIKAAKKLAKKLKPQPQKTRKRKREDDEDSSSSKSYRPKKRVTKKGPPKKRGRPRKIVHKPLRRGSYQYGVSRIISRQMVSAGKWEYKLEMEPLDDDFREAVAVMSSDVYITGSGNQEEDIHNILSCRVERGETFYKVLWKGRREILLPESIMRLMYPVALQNYCERQANAQRVNGRTMGSSGYLTSRTAVYINDIEDNASSGLDDDTCMLVRALSRLKSGDGVSPPSSPNVSCSLEKLSEKASLEAPVTVSEKPSPEKQTARLARLFPLFEFEC